MSEDNGSEMQEQLPVDDLARLRLRRSAKWSVYEPDVLPLPVAEMDYALAPAVQEVLADAVAHSDTGYAMANPALGEALAGFAHRQWGWTVAPEHVYGMPDVGVAAVEMLRTVCQPGDSVVVSPPVYPPFFHWVHEVRAQVVTAPLRQDAHGCWRLDLQAIEDAFRRRPRAYVLCNPHNPVGRVHTADELVELARLAAEHGVTIIADEIHAPLVLPGARFTPFLTVPGGAEVGVSLVSASKAFNLAGLKCAAVVAQSTAMNSLTDQLPPDARWRVGHLGLLATVTALTVGDDWLALLVATLAERRSQLDRLIAARLPQVRWQPPEATYLGWLDCSEIGAADTPQRLFLDRGRVALEPGPAFGPGGDGHVRINFATSAPILDCAVKQMAGAAALPSPSRQPLS